jgi:coenzyme F420-reducing hydrogenase alpha subunit
MKKWHVWKNIFDNETHPRKTSSFVNEWARLIDIKICFKCIDKLSYKTLYEKDKQRSTKHTTKDRVTQTPL